jgi:hypothetical protein
MVFAVLEITAFPAKTFPPVGNVLDEMFSAKAVTELKIPTVNISAIFKTSLMFFMANFLTQNSHLFLTPGN